ncbi:MAG: cell division protein FtsQ/DivIB [Pseudomonadota bacterium]
MTESAVNRPALSRRIAVTAACALVAAALVAYAAPRLFDAPVDRVVIEGNLSGAERGAVRAAVATALAAAPMQSLHALGLDDLRAEVSRLPWLDQVSVRRRWPGTLSVAVRKAHIVARWGRGGYVAGSGKLIDATADAKEGLPLLDCVTAAPSRAMDVFQLVSASVAEFALAPTRLVESPLGEWTAVLDNDVRIVLGREDLDGRLERFRIGYRDELGARAGWIDTVDARYHNGLAVRWRATGDTPEIQARFVASSNSAGER